MRFVVSRLAGNNSQPSAQALAHNLGRAAGSLLPSGATDNAAQAKESFLSRLFEKVVIGAAKGGVSGAFKLGQKYLEDHRNTHRNRVGNLDSSRVTRENDIKSARRLQRQANVARNASKAFKWIDYAKIGKDVVNGNTEDAISKAVGMAAGTATTTGCTGALTTAEGASVVGAPLIPPTVIGCSVLGGVVGAATTEVAKPIVRWGGNVLEDVADKAKNAASDSANWTSNAAKNTVNFVGDILP